MLLPLLLACATLTDDIATMCNAPSLSGVTEKDPSTRAPALARWIEGNLKTTEGRTFFAALPMIPGAERGPLLRQRAKEAGIAACPYAAELGASVTP